MSSSEPQRSSPGKPQKGSPGKPQSKEQGGSQGKRAEKAAAAAAVRPLTAAEAARRARHLTGMLAQHADPQGFADTLTWIPAEPSDLLIERIVVAEQLISWARSLQVEDIAALGALGPHAAYAPYGLPSPSTSKGSRGSEPGLTGLDEAEMDLACALVLSRRQASRRIDDAVTFRDLPG